MVYIAIISLVLGILVGANYGSIHFFQELSSNSDWILIILMLSVGISVGLNKEVFKNIYKHKIKIVTVPLGTIIGTLIGGIIASLLLDMHIPSGLAIASGMGWYSLSGIMIGKLLGSDYGTIAFFSNLLREIISFLIIPIVAKCLNYYAAIAPAGATSEDTTLPMLIKYCDEETVVIAVFHGVICSFMVPILIRLFLVL